MNREELQARQEVVLQAMTEGRCLDSITDRNDDHRMSFCMLPAEHAPLAHDDCMGCTWTDADHWQPSAVDRLADQIEAVRALHEPRMVGVLGPECAAEECDHGDP